MSSHEDPSGLHPEEPLQKLERSSLNISIRSREGPSTRVPPSSEVDRGKESHGIQPESDRDRETHEEESGGTVPFWKLINPDYSEISVGYARKTKSSRKRKEILRFLCTVLSDVGNRETNTVYSIDIITMPRVEINKRLEYCELRNWMINEDQNTTLGKWEIFLNVINSLKLYNEKVFLQDYKFLHDNSRKEWDTLNSVFEKLGPKLNTSMGNA